MHKSPARIELKKFQKSPKPRAWRGWFETSGWLEAKGKEVGVGKQANREQTVVLDDVVFHLKSGRTPEDARAELVALSNFPRIL